MKLEQSELEFLKYIDQEFKEANAKLQSIIMTQETYVAGFISQKYGFVPGQDTFDGDGNIIKGGLQSESNSTSASS